MSETDKTTDTISTTPSPAKDMVLPINWNAEALKKLRDQRLEEGAEMRWGRPTSNR